MRRASIPEEPEPDGCCSSPSLEPTLHVGGTPVVLFPSLAGSVLNCIDSPVAAGKPLLQRGKIYLMTVLQVSGCAFFAGFPGQRIWMGIRQLFFRGK